MCIILLNVLIFKKASRGCRLLQASNQKQETYLRSNMKAAKTILLLVIVFSVCWLPVSSLVLLSLICSGCYPHEISWIVCAINFSSIVINPLTYGFRNGPIKAKLKMIYNKIINQKNNDEREITNKIESLDTI